MKEKYQKLYLENFVYSEARFNDKKFLKYCERMIEQLFAVVEECFPTINIVFQRDSKNQKLENLRTFVTNYIYTMHYGGKVNYPMLLGTDGCPIIKDNHFHFGAISNFSVKYLTMPSLLSKRDFRELHKRIIFMASQDDDWGEFDSVFFEACANAFRRYISNYSLINDVKIEKITDLYEHCIPKNPYEYMEIARNIVDTYNQFLMEVATGTYLRDYKKMDMREIENLNSTSIEHHLNQHAENKKEIARLKEENEKLREMLQQETITRANIEKKVATMEFAKTDEKIREENFELIRKNAKLEQQIQELKAKCERDRKMAPVVNKSDIVNTHNIEECDKSKKYGFVVGDNLALQKNILDAFPNSIIITDRTKIFNVECVVFITECLGHSLYFKVKGVCDTHSIPYIHCHFKNTKCIETTIAEAKVV